MDNENIIFLLFCFFVISINFFHIYENNYNYVFFKLKIYIIITNN